ncbi:response regulator (plasmid) [Paracoccus liaowanqingii]|uniref:Response regulator n=1 Tax=Paracoccus liaowanqingii TaxID=2560053 RepID=A0A4Y5SSH8_9RHOB|nr:response regulator [Paracoccus liaowanqingii]QDA35908.1 response regulator [Paracoccus liaowanqingii]
MTNILQDARILLVEDEMLICLDIEDMLQEFGCKVVGPAATAAKALALIDLEQIDLAVLDVNLGHEKSYPIVDRLTLLDIPFLLSTGYAEIDARYDTCPRLQKPFSRAQLRDRLIRLRTVALDQNDAKQNHQV